MSRQSGRRKAWNEAMRSAAGGDTSTLPSAVQSALGAGGRRTTRQSDRKKAARRERARKATASGENDNEDEREYRDAARIDFLEEAGAAGDDDDMDGGGGGADPDDEYDELEELDGKSGSKKAKPKRRRTSSSEGKKGAAAAGVVPKRLRPRSLASILLEESARGDPEGHLQGYLDAESLVMPVPTTGPPAPRVAPIPPPAKFCPVTGLRGIYNDPKSGLRFANLKALEQIRERPPPWTHRGGAVTYHETIKSLRESYLSASSNSTAEKDAEKKDKDQEAPVVAEKASKSRTKSKAS